MTTDTNLHFSVIEFRPNPAEPKPSLELGLLLEFTTPTYWVVGLCMRAVLDLTHVGKLDQLSQELLDNRAKLFDADISKALAAASRPGDVLKFLANANFWSVHISTPIMIDVDRRMVTRNPSIEQLLEQYVVTLYQRALASEKPEQPRGLLGHLIGTSVSPLPVRSAIETPPPWMLPAQHWKRPLVNG